MGRGVGALETDLRTPLVISLSGLQAQAGNPTVIGSATPLTASVISGDGSGLYLVAGRWHHRYRCNGHPSIFGDGHLYCDCDGI